MGRATILGRALLLTLGTAACRSAAEEPRATTAVPVAVARAVRDSLVEEIVVVGRLAPVPGHDAVLTAAAAGVVRRVAAPVGTAVTAGELVVALDVPELVATARQQAVAAGQAEREASRQRQLFSDGLTSRRGLEEAEAAAQTATAAAAAAKELLARTEVRSPITGRIQRITVQQGTRVDAGATLAEVIASDPLDLIAAVQSDGLARLGLRQSASVMGEGDPTPHAGRVVALAPAVDTLTNAGQVLVRVPNREDRLHAGAAATARITVTVRRDVLVVPEAALVLAGDRPAVFVVGGDSIARRRPVAVGIHQGGRAEVKGPLDPGEMVVTIGAAGLEDGLRVVPHDGPTW